MAITRNTKGPFRDNTNTMFYRVIGKIKTIYCSTKFPLLHKPKARYLKTKKIVI